MQEYKFIHQLSEHEYIELYHIVSNSQTMQGIGQGEWTLKKLLETRNFSAQDYAKSWNTREYFYWAILVRDNKDIQHVIGLIGFHPVLHPLIGLQIMYVIVPNERGKGRATRSIRDIMSMKEVINDTRAIWGIIRENNIPSIRAIEKSGYFERYLRMPNLEIRRINCVIFKRNN